MSAAELLDHTAGAILIGTLLSMSLWGVGCVQTYEYFLTNTDRNFQRSIIAVLWVIDTTSSAFDCITVYCTFVTRLCDYRITPWSSRYHLLISGITNVIIRTMFAERIYKFSGKNVILTSWVMGISIADFIIAIVATYVTVRGPSADIVLSTITRYIYTSFALGFLADVSVTVVLCWLLQSAKTGFQRSNNIVNVLMVYTVNTGLLVTIDALLALITFTQNTLISYPFALWLSKLYLNSYLASLNAREKLKGGSGLSMPLSRLDTHSHSVSGGRISQVNDGKTHRQPMSITLQTTIERRVDDFGTKVDVM